MVSNQLRIKFSIRSFLILVAGISLALVFHEIAIEILIRGYWILITMAFGLGFWFARTKLIRSIVLPAILFPLTLLAFVYASSGRKMIIDPENANFVTALPGIEWLLNTILGICCQLHGDPLPGSIHLDAALLETLLILVIVGLLTGTFLGILVGLIYAPKLETTTSR